MRSGVFADVINQQAPSAMDIDNIVNAFVLKNFNEMEVLFQENQYPCDNLFIIKEGNFRGSKEMFDIASMKRGEILGELGFFFEMPHLLSVVAFDKYSSAYCLSKRDYRAIIEKGRDMRNIKIFRSLSDDQRSVLKKSVTILNFLKGSSNLFDNENHHCILVSPTFTNISIYIFLGEAVFCNHRVIYLILSGSLSVKKDILAPISPMSPTKQFLSDKDKNNLISEVGDSSKNRTMNPGEYIGAENFLDGCKESFKSFIAIKETSLCVMSEDLFHNEEIFEAVRAQIIIENDTKQKIKDRDTVKRKKSMRRLSAHLTQKRESISVKEKYTAEKNLHQSSRPSAVYCYLGTIPEEESDTGINQSSGLDVFCGSPRSSSDEEGDWYGNKSMQDGMRTNQCCDDYKENYYLYKENDYDSYLRDVIEVCFCV
jgi:CRP-like cAMP-binding protein